MKPMTSRSRTLLAGTAIAAVLALPLGLAAASEMEGTPAGKTIEEIKAGLAEQGYDVRKIEREDGQLEAYALKDGKRYELYIDPASGEVTKVEEDD